MYKCLNCGFSLTSKMKHSILSNKCPACGSNVLSEETVAMCKAESSEISKNEFMRGIDQYMIKIISLYVVNKMKPYLNNSEEISDKSEDGDSEIIVNSKADDFNAIRKEIEDQVLKENDVLFDENEEESRVERLKRVAKDNAINKPGTQVRRVSM